MPRTTISGRAEDWAEGPLDYNYTDVLVILFSESMNCVLQLVSTSC